MIRDQPVGVSRRHHVVRHMGLRPVDEPRDDVACAIELRHRIELILVEEALGQRPVDHLPHPSILPVDQVLDRDRGIEQEMHYDSFGWVS